MPRLLHAVFSLFCSGCLFLPGAVLCAQDQLSPLGSSDWDFPLAPVVPLPELDDPLSPSHGAPSRERGAEIVEEGSFPSPAPPRRPAPAVAARAEIVDEHPRSAPVSRFSAIPVPRDQTKVSVLGYHDFSIAKPTTRMRMKTGDFREQMQRVKNSGATVIGMEDYIQWKTGEKQLPAECVLITLDDGWKSVYTDAFPILREFGYPFTLFLYTQYVNSGGASLTWDMIKEMQAHGAAIGSHSHTHPYPSNYRKVKKSGAQAYLDFLKKEMGESKRILEEKLGTTVNAYCYPGGYRTPEMYDVLKELGYKAGFDVIAGKSMAATDDLIVPRYMVLGVDLRTFNGALQYGGSHGAAAPTRGGLAHSSPERAGSVVSPSGPVPQQVVAPRANSLQPIGIQPVSINLAADGDIQTDSLVMRVSGFGKVPAIYDEASKTLTWTPNRPLRGEVSVVASWSRPGSKTSAPPVEWRFSVSEYAPEPSPSGWIP